MSHRTSNGLRRRNSAPPIVRQRDPQPVSLILPITLAKQGLDVKMARYQFIHHWREIVGEDIARRTRPECLRRGTLVVRVVNSAWAQELAFRKEVILSRLKRFVSRNEVVTDVHFYVAHQDVRGR
jgi:predicted nucleic acid-binding Zn ribbon protein